MGINSDAIKFGRKIPFDWGHVNQYAFQLLAFPPVKAVERILPVPYLDNFYDQNGYGACVGFASSRMMSFYNRLPRPGRLYDAMWLWQRAKSFDSDLMTKEGDDNGTYVNAAFKVLRKEGHRLFVNDNSLPVNIDQGIRSYYWAKTVDEMRTAISMDRPVVLGINWYSEFMCPVKIERDGKKEWWIGTSASLGYVSGGHAILCYAASDKREAFRLMNTWGRDYPKVWVSYTVMNKLLHEYGEACVAIDRPE
ncbi:MAG: hypothetical protein JW908_00550 [Anaerolineales bacterium]|nr:hypothetical protein [Anaerolineales bacterium]